MNPPTKVEGLLTKTRGRASLVWKGDDGARVYNVFMSTTNNPYNWTLVSATTKQRFNVDGLVAGTFYYFAVSAVGTGKQKAARANRPK
ncbi:MAG: fibronectin type III domain-containing protein [Flavobacteriales bacterium]